MSLCGIFLRDPATNVWRCSILLVTLVAFQLEEFLTARRAAVSEAYTRCAREDREVSPLESTPLCPESGMYPNGVRKSAVWGHYMWYRDTVMGISNATGRRIALGKLRTRSSEGMVAHYLEREQTRDSQSTLRERLAFKWYNLWSSIRTRAAIDDVVQEYCNELPSDAKCIPERVRRHFVSYTANMLEYKYLERPARLISSAILYGTLLFVFFLPTTTTTTTIPLIIALPWVHNTLALTVIGLASAMWHFANLYRWTELLGVPVRYTEPQEVAMLHAWWSDWERGYGRRLEEAKMWNKAVTGRGPEARAVWVSIVAQVAVADASGVV
ncbi:hypothetical protein EIP86_003499 [Pleurotus ostreatoroseus]|nr:hypothetical protein EIP86_003499 [Pleurotus ostreatoroseus]